MEWLSEAEAKVGELYRNVPHLPKTWREWLADNVWWLVIIFVAFNAIAALGLASYLFNFSWYTELEARFQELGVGHLVGFVAFIGTAAAAVAGAVAVGPLRAKLKSGWDWLFVAGLILVASAALRSILVVSLYGLLVAALQALIGFYFIFEIRQYFARK